MKKFLIILSIISAWIFALSDYLLDMRNMFGPPFYSVFKGMSLNTVIYATFCLFAFPFLAYGLDVIFKNSNISYMSPFMKGFLATVPIFIHSSFLYYYFVVNGLEDPKILLDKFEKYKNFMGILYFLGVAALCAILFIVIIRGKTSYPKHFAWINPLVFVIILNILQKLSPSIANVVYPVFVPATILAVMMSIYLIYDLKRGRLG